MAYKDKEYGKARARELYRSNPKRKLKIKESNKDRKLLIAERYSNFKIKMGCSKCGYKKCSQALEPHHKDKDSKEINPSRMITNGWSWERILNELSKCEILCANCHREEHYLR